MSDPNPGTDTQVILQTGENTANIETLENQTEDLNQQTENLEQHLKWTQDDINNLHRRLSEQDETISGLEALIIDLESRLTVLESQGIAPSPSTNSPDGQSNEGSSTDSTLPGGPADPEETGTVVEGGSKKKVKKQGSSGSKKPVLGLW